MYVTVSWRPNGAPDESAIIDAASAGWSSRKDQNCLEIYEGATYEECVEFLKRLISWGHTSVLEHIVFKFHASLTVACASQLTRHRIASYTQKSYRQAKDLYEHSVWGDTPFIVPPQVSGDDVLLWIVDMNTHISIYNRWLEKGYESDVARFHLPQGLATNIAITMNARSLRNMFGMRLESHAMFEFQQLCELMIELIKQKGLYFLFEDVVEEALQK